MQTDRQTDRQTIRATLTLAHHACIFRMSTVSLSPAKVLTVLNEIFRPIAHDLIQPNLTLAWTKSEEKKYTQMVASFPGSHILNVNIEDVEVWRAWYFSHVSIVKGRKGVERSQLCMGIPEGSEHEKKSKGSEHCRSLVIGNRTS